MNGSSLAASELTHRVSRANGIRSKLLSDAGFDHLFGNATLAARHLLAACVDTELEQLFEVEQVHGAVVAVAGGSAPAMRQFQADALVATAERRRAVAVRTADCVPVLIADRRSGAVAAVHAGWRGMEAEVIAAAVRALPEGADLVAAIGPHIGPCCFEVSAEVGQRIADASVSSAILRRYDDKCLVDLGHAAKHQLLTLGLRASSVEQVFVCTRCGEGFHSYRRDAGPGRQWSVIRTQPLR